MDIGGDHSLRGVKPFTLLTPNATASAGTVAGVHAARDAAPVGGVVRITVPVSGTIVMNKANQTWQVVPGVTITGRVDMQASGCTYEGGAVNGGVYIADNGASNCIVRNVAISNGSFGGHGIAFEGVHTNWLVSQCEITNPSDGFVMMWYGISAGPEWHGFRIEHSIMIRNAGWGTRADHGFTFQGPSMWGGNDNNGARKMFDCVDFNNYWDNGTGAQGGFGLEVWNHETSPTTGRGFTVSYSDIRGGFDHLISAVRSRDNWIHHNKFRLGDGAYSCYEAAGTDHLRGYFENNTVTGVVGGKVGIYHNNSAQGMTVRQNTFIATAWILDACCNGGGYVIQDNCMQGGATGIISGGGFPIANTVQRNGPSFGPCAAGVVSAGLASGTGAVHAPGGGGVVASNYVNAVLADSPVAYWRLGEPSGTFADIVGTNTASPVGSPTRSVPDPYLAPPTDGGVSFPTDADYITAPNAAALGFGDGPVTIEFLASRGADGTGFQIALNTGINALNVGICDGLGSVLDDKIFIGKRGVTILSRGGSNVPGDASVHHYALTRMGHYVEYVQSLGPVGYWRFGDTSGTVAADMTGLHAGTYVGSPTLGVAGPLVGDANTAVTLNGTSQRVRINSGAILSGATAVSVAFWLNCSPQDADFQYLLNDTSDKIRLYFAARGQTGVFGRLGGTVDHWLIGDTVSGGPDLTGGWKFIVVTVSAAGVQTSYVNGAAALTTQPTGHTTITVSDLSVGSPFGGTINFLAGSLDDLAIFNRVLTPAEVTQLYTVAGTGNVMKIYTDGVESHVDLDTTTVVLDTADPFVLGQEGGGTRWRGMLDEVAIYRTVLSPARIAAHVTAASYVSADIATGTGTGSATNAAGSVKASAIRAMGTGAATGATVTVPSSFSASAAIAAGTGTSAGQTTKVAAKGGIATATGAAAAGTTTKVIVAQAGIATGTGGAYSSASPAFQFGAFQTDAFQSQIVADAVHADANAASGTGTASGITAKVAPRETVAVGTGAASGVTGAVAATVGIATGSGAGIPATVTISIPASVSVSAGIAAGTGLVLLSSETIVSPITIATGTGDAPAATGSLGANAVSATGTGAAGASVSTPVIETPAGHAFGAGAALDATPNRTMTAEIATGTGFVHGASISTEAVFFTGGTPPSPGRAVAAVPEGQASNVVPRAA